MNLASLRGYEWTGTNWTEIGQSAMKWHRKAWCLYATWEDVCTSIIEEKDYINFINNHGKNTGRLQIELQCVLKGRKAQAAFTDAAVEALVMGNIQDEVEKFDHPDA